MTDEKLIEWFRKIKEHCSNPKACDGCVFCGDNGCQIMAIVDEMRGMPMFWNLVKIERIIKQ